eukprot:scaffold60838_cov61-Attheya_sp.AAC.1
MSSDSSDDEWMRATYFQHLALVILTFLQFGLAYVSFRWSRGVLVGWGIRGGSSSCGCRIHGRVGIGGSSISRQDRTKKSMVVQVEEMALYHASTIGGKFIGQCMNHALIAFQISV